MSFDKRNEEIRKQREIRRDEGKKSDSKKSKKTRKKSKNKALPVVIISGIIIAIVLTVLSLTVFFKASHVTVKGDSRYETKQIITAADISSSQNMILLNKSKVENRIINALPYIGKVDVKINLLTSTVTLVVYETEPFGAVKFNDEFLLIDSSGKFLEKTTNPTCRKIYVEKVETPEVGKVLSFGEEGDMETLIKLVKTLEKLSITEITAIDFSNSSDIRLLYKDMQIWKLGTKSVLSNDEKIEYKLKFCIKESQSEEGKMGVVDVSAMTINDVTKYGYFREEVVTPEEFVVPPSLPEEKPAEESSQIEESSDNSENNETEEDDESEEENSESSAESDEEQEEDTSNDGENEL